VRPCAAALLHRRHDRPGAHLGLRGPPRWHRSRRRLTEAAHRYPVMD
jgi:hypothetical protein